MKIFGNYLILSIIDNLLGHGSWITKNRLDAKKTGKFRRFLAKIQSEESLSMAVSCNNQFGYKYQFVLKEKMDIHDQIPIVKVVEKVDIIGRIQCFSFDPFHLY